MADENLALGAPPPGAAAVPPTVAAAAPALPTITIRPRNNKNAPVRKLTTGLLATYKNINTKYYEQKKSRLARQAGKPEEYQVVVGDVLGTHYRVEESLGKGSFGQVVAAVDSRTDVKYAVKVIKNKEAFRRQARTEVRLLELLNRKDPEDHFHIGEWAVQ